MHQWESLEKLIKVWEAQEVKDPFKYEAFQYNPDEWENVPPVIPRFLYYLQNCLDRCIQFSHEVNERQTTQSLKDEMYKNFEEFQAKLDSEQNDRERDFKESQNRSNDLQSQIDGLNKYNADKVAADFKKGQEDLNSETYLNLQANFK